MRFIILLEKDFQKELNRLNIVDVDICSKYIVKLISFWLDDIVELHKSTGIIAKTNLDE